MSPIPKANEPGNNPQSAGGGDSLEPPPQDFNSVLNTGDMSSEDEDSDDGGGGGGGEAGSQYGGYQLLLQDPEHLGDEDGEDEEEETDESTEGAQSNPMLTGNIEDLLEQEISSRSSQSSGTGMTNSTQQPNLPAHLAKLLPTASPAPDVASQVTHSDTQVSLEQRKNVMAADDQIRAAMAGFSLPTAAIPPWARTVEEEDWKEQLVARIQRKHEKQLRTGGDTPQKGSGGKR